MTLVLFSEVWGKIILEKNLKQKISWHCPFNATVLHLQVVAEERSLGSYLELYTRCLEAENTTLMRNPTQQTDSTIQLTFRYSAYIPLFSSHSAIQLTFRYSAHIPLFSLHSTIQLTFRNSAYIPLFSSHSAIQLTFRYSAHIPLSTYIPLFSSHSAIQLTFRYSAHILVSSHSATLGTVHWSITKRIL